MSADTTKTREMPVVETVTDLYRDDPLGIYSHRQMDSRDTDSTSFITSNAEWQETRHDYRNEK
jgi:hypothetical protein